MDLVIEKNNSAGRLLRLFQENCERPVNSQIISIRVETFEITSNFDAICMEAEATGLLVSADA